MSDIVDEGAYLADKDFWEQEHPDEANDYYEREACADWDDDFDW